MPFSVSSSTDRAAAPRDAFLQLFIDTGQKRRLIEKNAEQIETVSVTIRFFAIEVGRLQRFRRDTEKLRSARQPQKPRRFAFR